MEEQYSQEQLEQFDEIIERLSKGQTIDVNDYPQSVYAILAKKGWISDKNRYNPSCYYSILQGHDFDGLLAGGTFSKRYFERKRSNAQSIIYNVNAHNSNVSIGNQNNQVLNVSISLFENAIEEIQKNTDLSNEDKEELIDLFGDLKTAGTNQQPISTTVLKKLARWGERIIHLGGSIAAIYQTFYPLIQPYLVS